MRPWSGDGAFESRSARQLIAGLLNRAVDDIRKHRDDIIGVHVGEREFVPLVGHASEVSGVDSTVHIPGHDTALRMTAAEQQAHRGHPPSGA